jgi:diacylglycerol O-acyltransferase / trehalose O-mycolyltransferase
MRPRRLVAVGAVIIAVGVAASCSSSGSSTSPSSPSGSSSSHSARPTVADITATKRVSARMVDLTVDSPALGHAARVRLILPRDFASRPQQRWPVLYLLHGCCDTYLSWSRSTDVVRFFGNRNVLVVMPDGGSVGFYSDWLHGPRWETFHLVELLTLLGQHYRAGSARAIAGLSMGGLGALDYTARHPGMFRAVASFSGIVDTRLDASVSSGYQRLASSYGANPDDLWGDPTKDAAQWKAHNPTDLIAKLGDTPAFVSSGTGDPGPLDKSDTAFNSIEASIYAENRVFGPRLRAADAHARIDFYGPGTHNWPYWQREFHRAWPMLAAALRVPA